MKLILFGFVVLLLGACSGMQRTNGTRSDQSLKYDIITVEEQALADVMATPTEFIVSHGDDAPSWERAELFYDKYAGKSRVIATEKGISIVSDIKSPKVHSGKDSSGRERFVYEVSKSFIKQGYLYRIRCLPLEHSPEASSSALRNAKNLARFIRAGELQVSLLVK